MYGETVTSLFRHQHINTLPVIVRMYDADCSIADLGTVPGEETWIICIIFADWI